MPSLRLGVVERGVGVVDYAAGNSASVVRALRHLGAPSRIVARPDEIVGCSHIVLPGVGSAGATMASLRETGMADALTDAVRDGMPYIGICVGLQIVFERSEEEDAACLGWLPGIVRRLPSTVRLPQIGWNLVRPTKDSATADVVAASPLDGYFYFVNSYVAHPTDPAVVVAEADYGGEFPAAIRAGNVFATQFHLEKSGPAGLVLLRDALKAAKRC